MKGSQTLSRTNYLPTSIGSRFFNASKFYLLPFWFATSVLIGSTAVVSFAATPEIAQVVVGGSVNRPTLKLGSQGERVSELQGALKLLGYYTGTVDGNFNQMTANAVSQFKQAAGLAPDGIVDGNTWQRLFPGEGTVASSPALPNPASKFPTPNDVTDNATPESKPSSPSTSQTTVRQSSPSNGTSTSRSEQTLRTTSTDGAGQTSSSEQIVRTTSTSGSGETVRTSRQTPRNQTASSGETVRTSRQTPRNQTASSGETVRTSRQTPRNQTASSGQTTRTSRQTASSGQTTRTSRQTASSGQTTRQTPSIQYTAGGMPILRLGMRGSEVVKLQERLKRLGFLNGDVDGDFGASTEAAVKAAQQRYGLEPDGIAGGATWDVLARRRSQPL
jgi:peptidoglycan hydrolase-like protein with peptidoglycan-binding domain